MKTLELKTKWGKTEKIRIEISSYRENGGIYIGLISVGGTFEEPYGNATVNLGGSAIEYCGYLDTSNLPELEEFITENGLGEHTGFTKRSGFNEYPFYVFSAKRLEELCPEGLVQYEQSLTRDGEVSKKVNGKMNTKMNDKVNERNRTGR